MQDSIITEADGVKIAVLSGKGGTGKTFVSVNLARVIPNSTYLDCDVEAPNGHLFLTPKQITVEEVCVPLPEVDVKRCIHCRKCVDVCRFNALAWIKENPVRFKDVCHACGGCRLVCPAKAIEEREHPVGVIETGRSGNVLVRTGKMNPGEESGVPIIRKLVEEIREGVTIIDCPPGSACTVMESVETADICLLVAEPTLFGVHNFKMVQKLVSLLKKPFGVIINKDPGGEHPMVKLCEAQGYPLWMRMEYREEIAGCLADGMVASEQFPDVKKQFEELFKTLVSEVRP